MAVGCSICSEVYSSADGADKYPLAIKSCGHCFHAACLKTWLSKARTCPVCRCVCQDTNLYLIRLHLQSVNSFETSFETLKDPDSVKVIEELRNKIEVQKVALEKIRGYYNETKKLNYHIGIELGDVGTSPTSIDLTDLTELTDMVSPPHPAVVDPPTVRPAATRRVVPGVVRANARVDSGISARTARPGVSTAAAFAAVRARTARPHMAPRGTSAHNTTLNRN